MRRSNLILALAILLVLVTAALAQESVEKMTGKPMAPHYTNLADAKAASLAKQRPLLIDFYAVW
ncbi:MAG TPA: hypothetical protein VMS71_05450 [Candidatus Acidoferrum sp.]|nr:hypothetical protein [Candidatus Acidoferrum sp.]